MSPLASVISAHLREWAHQPTPVEDAIFQTADPAAIAGAITDFCRRALSAGVASGLFYQSSIGAVAGLILDDGRRVVVKAHQPERSVEGLREVVRVQRHLAERGLFATNVVAGPLPLGAGQAIVEELAEAGALVDGHRPEIARALAAGLFAIVEGCGPLVAGSTLGPLVVAPAGRLWPVPHSKLFDFERTARGAEWIDAVAGAARAEMAPAGEIVIGHGDWRVEHVRFEGERPVVAFDWDSLCREREPSLVGVTAHGFAADWTRPGPNAPTLEEARGFVAAYEAARGRAFSAPERRLCGAAFAYACAYTARCGHALGADEREIEGTFMHLVAREGERLVAL